MARHGFKSMALALPTLANLQNRSINYIPLGTARETTARRISGLMKGTVNGKNNRQREALITLSVVSCDGCGVHCAFATAACAANQRHITSQIRPIRNSDLMTNLLLPRR